ncbi:alpha/beta fold hydrolase [Corynebacterium sp. 319]|uniref:polyketide synthase Pks13 n=1 Tax=unclassified Corynebacterium TaxID=2624378 RepID=UPI00125CC4E5|nr:MULTISPECIES: polyketide synthase Pks13 [unclassified Corynebacterium]KAB1554534.1 alpha/beta fold hydrolase [Corynebacterium sp. 319]KAB3540844.1 alpha/beta fold hydrolase [Corynebacterium sp. 366]
MRQWLREWVAGTAGLSMAEITDDRSMEEFGLSSRDVVVLSGDLERLTGDSLDATVAYEFNTIAALADYLINGRATGANAGQSAYPADSTAHSGQALAPEDRDIAIVGMSGRYPGADNAQEMWDMLSSYRDGISEPPAGRWTEYAGDESMTRRMAEATLTGGYLEDIASFDAEFFGLSPLEATNMDPQQRIMLELAWEALEDASIPANTLRGDNVGVFMGTTNNDYANLISADPQEAHPYALTGNSTAVIANRISYAFDFRGPSVALDTACSSSLVAIHQAVRALRDGDATVALAGGVNILASPFATVAFSELGVLSPTGKIHAFSEDADGIVRSDGAGVVVLKRLSDARRDGDSILAVIKGSAVNSDGRSNGLTAPNPDAQVDVLRAAYADAGISPDSVDYVEAHGTGTILGDPIEATALGTVLGAGRSAAQPLLLGSAKTNFGHTEAAAGVAGVMKVVMGMQDGSIPPTLNFAGPNPYIDFDREHLEVVEDSREWPEYSGRAVAGVSGFGFGGTNAHVVIAAYDPERDAPRDADASGAQTGAQSGEPGVKQDRRVLTQPPYVLPVSGLLPSRRRVAADALATWLENNESVELGDVARALAGRNHGRSRGAVIAEDREAAIAGLQRIAAGKSGAQVKTQDAPSTTGAVWVYSGFGSQHRKMGKELFELSPFFAATLRDIDEVVQRESGFSIVDMILDDEQNFDTTTAQVGITCIQIALTDLLRHVGASPAAVVGQSMGEIAAAYAVGGLSKEDSLTVACHRSRLMGEGESLLTEDKQGAMAVVEFGVEELATFTAEHPEFEQVEPAVYAAPGMTTVGGPAEPVKKLVEYLEGEGKFARLLNVKGAGHTSMLDPILGELHFEISDIQARPIHTPLYSTVDRGTVYRPGESVHTADYFVRCTRQPVWFADATGQQFDDGYRTFVEIAPNPVALMPLMNNAFAHEAGDSKLLFALKRKEPAARTLTELLGELYVQGADLDLKGLVGPDAGTGRIAPVPGVKWNLQRYWTNARPAGGALTGLPGRRVNLPNGQIVFSTDAAEVPSLDTLASRIGSQLSKEDPEIGSVKLILMDLQEHVLPSSGELTTVVDRTLGGWSLRTYDASLSTMPLIGERFLSTLYPMPDCRGGSVDEAGDQIPVVPVAGDSSGASAGASAGNAVPEDRGNEGVPAGQMVRGDVRSASNSIKNNNKLPEVDPDADRWSPESGVSVSERLREIVSESMGYDVEDLPGELPLIDLGLDSLMGMRIKNRVEYEFDIPSLQVQTLRDGSVDDVIAMVEQMVADRHGLGEAALAGEGAEGADAESTDAESTSDYTVKAGGVAPRDASERLVFATWAKITGAAAAGVTSELPAISEEQAKAIAERLSERSHAEITAEDVLHAKTMESLSTVVRQSLETEVEGNIRVLRARPDTEEGAAAPAVFLFHPAGGSASVYQPLTRRLPENTPVYGVERLEGDLSDRVAAYLDEIVELSAGQPVILGGWSFGGALAYEAAQQLQQRAEEGQPSAKVARIILLDTVQPRNPAPDTKEEMHARWDRYAAFAQKTYGLPLEIPHDLLESQGEGVMLAMFQQFLDSPEAHGLGLPAGVLEHQRASFVDNRVLDSLDFQAWASVDVPVTLFRAERMHDGALELEPALHDIAEDGNWGQIVKDLEIIHLHGDHLAVVDEPEISTVGAVMSQYIASLVQ